MSDENNHLEFNVDLTKGSLDREPERKKRERKQGADESYGDSERIREDELTQQIDRQAVLQEINERFTVELADDANNDPALIVKLLSLVSGNATIETGYPTLDLVLTRVEESMGGNGRWKKVIVLGTIHYGWVVARAVIPGFSGLENISDGIVTRDENKILRGVLNIAGLGNVSSILFEFLPEYVRSLGA